MHRSIWNRTAILLAVATSAVALTSCSSTSTSSSSSSPATGATTTSAGNVWKSSVSPTALPLGDSRVSTTGPAVGGLFACTAGAAALGGAFRDGPWIHGSTWDLTAKISVQGARTWPMAAYSTQVANGVRTITTTDLPVRMVTGTFPIAPSDPAYSYDRNPNSIASQRLTYSLPTTPTPLVAPACLGGGAVGVLDNGVLLYSGIDGQNRDAVAHEIQDVCQGHPQQASQYHYHDVPICIRNATSGPATVVGFALNGNPIVVEHDAKGALPTDGDLDACHGRTSAIVLDGKQQTTYHYDATLEFPYTLGCYHSSTLTAVG